MVTVLKKPLKDYDASKDVASPQTSIWKMAEETNKPEGGRVGQHDQPSSRRLPARLSHRNGRTLGELRRPLVPEGGPEPPAPELQERAEPVPRVRAAAEAAPRQPGRTGPVQPDLGTRAGQSEAEMQLASPPGCRGRGGRVFARGARKNQQESGSWQPEFWTGFNTNKPRRNTARPNRHHLHVQFGSGTLHTGRRTAGDG